MLSMDATITEDIQKDKNDFDVLLSSFVMTKWEALHASKSNRNSVTSEWRRESCRDSYGVVANNRR